MASLILTKIYMSKKARFYIKRQLENICLKKKTALLHKRAAFIFLSKADFLPLFSCKKAGFLHTSSFFTQIYFCKKNSILTTLWFVKSQLFYIKMTLFYKVRGLYWTYLKLSFIYMVRSIFDTNGIPEYLTLFLGMGQFSYHQRASDPGRSSQRI